jgi:hypothetical protein
MNEDAMKPEEYNELMETIFGDFATCQKLKLQYSYRKTIEGESGCSSCSYRVEDEAIPFLSPHILSAFCEFVKGPLYAEGTCSLYHRDEAE